MSRSVTNNEILERVGVETRDIILASVASHYGVSVGTALAEVTHENAEHLLDYLTEPCRTPVALLVCELGFTFT